VDALDAHLWTYSDPSFLPHGGYRERDSAEQPILLTVGEGNDNGSSVRFLVDSVALPADPAQYERIVLLFDGADEAAVSEARVRWQQAKAAGFAATYWRESEGGRWERQG
jgi:DNA polymerase-3 subunit chi